MLKKIDPILTGITVALSTATATGSLLSTLGIATASVVITGAATLGIFAGTWIWYKQQKMRQAIKKNKLTPKNSPYICGIEGKKQNIIDQEIVKEDYDI